MKIKILNVIGDNWQIAYYVDNKKYNIWEGERITVCDMIEILESLGHTVETQNVEKEDYYELPR